MRALDLFCGAGGASMGLHRAGFEVVGVDIELQPHYPFTFVQADALRPPFDLSGVDLIWASPPCQKYSIATRNIGTAEGTPDLLGPTRVILESSGVPWIIENVPGAPMRADVVLCGCMFGLPIRRRRLFELSAGRFDGLVPSHNHEQVPIGVYGNGTPSWHRGKLGRNIGAGEWRDAMGIPWMVKTELSQAVPPAYAEFLGRAALLF